MDINVDPVTPKAALEIMKNTLTVHRESGFNIPFFLHGQPGVGKSDIVQQLADWAGMNLEVEMLTQIEATDLRGLQFIDEATKKTVNYVPEWLPGPDDPPTIIFLDELPSAEPRLQVSGYQLLLQGRIGRYVLDRKHYVCAAGNRIDDGAVVYEMGTALADRLQHLVVIPEVRAWLDWARDNNIHPAVMTFLQLHGHMLEQLEEQLKASQLVGPSPRSWQRVSQILHVLGADNRTTTEPLVQGWLGNHVAKDFYLTVEEMAGLPEPEKILEMDEKDFKKVIPEKLTNMWGLAFSLVAFADTPEQMDKATKFFRVMVEEGPRTLPIEDVRKMGMEMMLEKAQKKNIITKLFDKEEIQKYMDQSEEVLAIGES